MPAAPDSPELAAQRRAALRVLLVDDNVDAATTLQILLQALGFQAACAHDADAARTLAERWQPAAVVIDVALPGLDGYELAQALQRDCTGRGERTPRLLCLTGSADADSAARALAAGFAAHFLKPVDIDALLAALHA